MRTVYAILGVFALLVAGFIRGSVQNSNDPELTLSFAWGVAGLGLIGVLAAGVATGIKLARQ